MLGVFLDLETTGLDATTHSVIEIAYRVVNLSTNELIDQYHSVIRLTAEDWDKRDPISIDVNGFSWDKVLQGKEISLVRKEIIQMLNAIGLERGKAVFICQNPAFDRAFFAQIIDIYTHENMKWPYHWLDLASMFWAKQVQKSLDNNQTPPESILLSKDEIAKVYQLPTEEKPHRAMNGVNHLILCYQAVVNNQNNPINLHNKRML